MVEGDGLPGQVCLQCVHYITRAFSFKQLCEQSDATLRQLLGKPIITSYIEHLKPNEHIEAITTLQVMEQKPTENIDLKMEMMENGGILLPRKYILSGDYLNKLFACCSYNN